MLKNKFLQEQQNPLLSEDDDCEVPLQKGERKHYHSPFFAVLWMATGIVMGVLLGVIFSSSSRKVYLNGFMSGCECFQIKLGSSR